MTRYVALLRAVNVGGTGKLAMTDLKAICAAAGFQRIETYIASGNVVFESAAAAADVRARLDAALAAFAGRRLGVIVRSAAEMRDVLERNPFPDRLPNRTVAIFLDAPPPLDALDDAVGRADEEMRLGLREIYIHYGRGMARSKLRIPAAKEGTARNMNTVAKLAEMSARDALPPAAG